MIYILQLCYMITICVGVSALSVQIIVRGKNLTASNSLAKSGSATLFLVLVTIFNVCDYLTVFLGPWLGSGAVMWVLVAENVLEVALAYALIEMEREYFQLKESRPRFIFFTLTAAGVLWIDSAYTIGMLEFPERVYMILMVGLNLLPVLGVLVFTLRDLRKIFSGGHIHMVEGYFLLYNAIFFLLCIIITIRIADTRTAVDYMGNDHEMYVIFWFVFNIMNCLLIWKSCLHTDEVCPNQQAEEEDSMEHRLLCAKDQYRLSERELEIARLIYKGKNNNDIASFLFVSPNTVKVHTSNLYRKLGVKNRVQAVQVLRGETITDE